MPPSPAFTPLFDVVVVTQQCMARDAPTALPMLPSATLMSMPALIAAPHLLMMLPPICRRRFRMMPPFYFASQTPR